MSEQAITASLADDPSVQTYTLVQDYYVASAELLRATQQIRTTTGVMPLAANDKLVEAHGPLFKVWHARRRRYQDILSAIQKRGLSCILAGRMSAIENGELSLGTEPTLGAVPSDPVDPPSVA